MTEVKANISIVSPLTLYSSLHSSTPAILPFDQSTPSFQSLVLHRYSLESHQVLLCTSLPVHKGKRLDDNFINSHFTAGGTCYHSIFTPSHTYSRQTTFRGSGDCRLSLPWKPNYYFSGKEAVASFYRLPRLPVDGRRFNGRDRNL
jgi:hypothetical protein